MSPYSLTPLHRGLVIALCLGSLLAGAIARDFSVVTYNVENLFDADGVAVYEDYRPEKYTLQHLQVKVENIARVLKRIDEGVGPDILILNEVELDQTPDSHIKDLNAWLDSVKDKPLAELLSQDPLPDTLKGIPSEAWLLKACQDAGLKNYEVALTEEIPGAYEDGRGIAVRNIMLSRFPIRNVRTHPTANARAILEMTVDIDGHPLTLFANHWKSGAGDLESEEFRRGNARTLRNRLDEIFQADPNADVIVAGDLNSHYNQNRRYRAMKTTGINDILKAQGNELALRQPDGPDLYNLWFELPSNQRGSDIYKNEWGTLMHLILSRGLYDQNGIQYIDNSFTVMKIPGLNADVFGRPIRWSRGENPAGFSDHFPLFARFRTVDKNAKDRWMPLNQPSRMESGPGTPIRVETSTVDLFDSAVSYPDLPDGTNIRDGSFDGRVFLVEAPATVNEKGHVQITLGGEVYDVFTHNQDLRPLLREAARTSGQLRFYGELGTYRGRWQFVLHGKEWFPESAAN